MGGGVADLLKHNGYRVIEVKVGGGAQDKDMYMNHRTELWGRMRDWITDASLQDQRELVDDLCGPMYDFSLKGQLKLEPKERMKKRGHASPDFADALAATFSRSVARRDSGTSRLGRRQRVASDMDYSVI